jgi:DDE superfamily endonuclease
LTCLADGTKLQPVIIFKGKVWPRSTPPPPDGVVVWFQDKGWMDETGMGKWVKHWKKMLPGLNKSKAMLVFDSFSAHKTDQIKASLRSENTDLVIIPRGLTSMCQPLDVSINKPFKNNLRRYWHEWMIGGGNGVTKSGNLKRADLATTSKWVLNAWNDISNEIVIRAFKKYGISNCITGSEDHFIYEDEEKSGKNESEKSDEHENKSEESDNYENESEKSDEHENESKESDNYENESEESDEYEKESEESDEYESDEYETENEGKGFNEYDKKDIEVDKNMWL